MAVNTMSAFVVASLVSVALLSSVHVGAAGRVYQVDPAKSQVTIAVGKAGAFSFVAGHTHQVIGPIESGTVNVDPDDPSRSHVGLVISAAALKVSAAGEPRDDPPKVQQAMESDKVLDVQRYPRMTFESTAVALKRRDGAALDIVVTGQLTIRDVTQSISVPVHVQLAADGLVANGAFTIKQTAFGIKPISVGGVVAVKDALDLVFSIAARP